MKSHLKLLTGLALLACAGLAQAANHTVNIVGNTFSPAQLTIQAGDTVTWHKTGGFHNVVADDNSFRSGAATGAAFDFQHTFTGTGNFGYFCDVHGSAGGSGMAGVISVMPATTTPFVVNEGVQGSWYNPDFTSQGFFFDVSPSLHLIGVAWFTWTTTPGQYDWLTASGPFALGQPTQLVFNRSRGGSFNTGTATQTTQAGTGVLTFTDCSHASLQFSLTDPPANGTIALRRLLPVSALCTADNPNATGTDQAQ